MMNEEQQLIDRYLHGELDDAEQESLEQRFFADDDLFEQIEVAEMRLIDSYVRGEMDGSARERFESGYLTTPERSAKVAEARVFHCEIARMKPSEESWFARFVEGFSFSLSVPQLATVATILLLVIGAFWVFRILQSDLPDVAEGNVNMPVGPIDANVPAPVETPQQPDASPAATGSDEVPPSDSPSPRRDDSIPRMRDLMPPGGNDPTYTSRNGPQPTAVTLQAWDSDASNTFTRIVLDAGESSLSVVLLIPDGRSSESYDLAVDRITGERVLTKSGLSPVGSAGKRRLVTNLSTAKLASGRYVVKADPEGAPKITYGFEIAKRP